MKIHALVPLVQYEHVRLLNKVYHNASVMLVAAFVLATVSVVVETGSFSRAHVVLLLLTQLIIFSIDTVIFECNHLTLSLEINSIKP